MLECRVDCLRLDAVHAIFDFGKKHILKEIAESMEAINQAAEKHELFSEELMQKFSDLRALVNDILDPELMTNLIKSTNWSYILRIINKFFVYHRFNPMRITIRYEIGDIDLLAEEVKSEINSLKKDYDKAVSLIDSAKKHEASKKT